MAGPGALAPEELLHPLCLMAELVWERCSCNIAANSCDRQGHLGSCRPGPTARRPLCARTSIETIIAALGPYFIVGVLDLPRDFAALTQALEGVSPPGMGSPPSCRRLCQSTRFQIHSL